jgi:U2 small nuclear ribonucleoprotein A'
MVRLTTDLLRVAESRFNALQERELVLRGLKIPQIENLALLEDGYDVLDLSDNEVKKLDNFPLNTKRLSCLLLNNNSVSRISVSLCDQLVGLKELILTNNRLASLAEVGHLSKLRQLEHLVLLDNPVFFQAHYRLFVIHALPKLKSLDYSKVKAKERAEAQKLFSSATGRSLVEAAEADAKAQQETKSGDIPAQAKGGGEKPLALSDAQKRQVRAALEAAKTKEEVDRLEQQLKTGTFVFTEEEEEAAAAAAAVPTAAVAPTAAADEVNSGERGGSKGSKRSKAAGADAKSPAKRRAPVIDAQGDDDVDMS